MSGAQRLTPNPVAHSARPGAAAATATAAGAAALTLSGRLRALRRRDRCAVRVVVAMTHAELRRGASDPDEDSFGSALDVVRSAMRGEMDRHPDAQARAVSRALARIGA